ncbi:ABC transporter permease [Geminocystis sp. GBBB08]|uniref:ABC transporter permease n=1 Tax=Geminocystis sp. GBBB08 TaxID=2604140 RepID=UPI0027E2EA10|nr:ABC transporter permease [Geminocystis sp. GBBB08]MBL1211040.1 ABC transporter permease [Geminocystis sp. GBBB08]
MLTKMYPRVVDNVGEWNPQLFREVKGRLTLKTITIVSLASIIGQFLLYLYFEGMLPTIEGSYSRYCTNMTEVQPYSSNFALCSKDLLDNVQIIKELWWLDLFITMSVIGVFVLLVVGSYMLMADVSKENSRNTLNFIRLTPQSALTILGGKMLGVPILVYLFGILAIPLHLTAGLKANIPFSLIIGFYLTLSASCVFFYSVSLLFSLVSEGLGNFQGWFGSMAIFFFLSTMTGVAMEARNFTGTSFDWIIVFNPMIFLAYLVKSTFLSPDTVGYLSFDGLNSLNWYGNFWWKNSVIGLMLIIANYGIWTFWLWQGIKRRFHNPSETLISKYHSYLISACFIVFNLGFTLQEINSYSRSDGKIISLQIFNFFFFLLIIAALTPPRQSLQDWSRFPHENSSNHQNIISDLLLGEKSPSPLAVAVNIGIVTLYTIPSILIFPFEESKLSIIGGLFLGATMMMIYATVFQLLLMMKNKKRTLIASGVVGGLIISPSFFALMILRESHQSFPLVWLFSAFPFATIHQVSSFAILGSLLTQIMVIIGVNYQLKRVLNKVGISETKMLLEN